MQKARYVAALGIPLLALLSFTLVTAWTGPTQSPPGGNVPAPVNVGTIDQVKNGGLGVNALAVFGNSLFGGSTGSNAYLNFGVTLGTAGYGIRDNAGLLEFKNSGGSWKSIQSTVFDLVGGTGSWAVSDNDIYNSNTGNVGIGTSAPFMTLHVLSTSVGNAARIQVDASDSHQISIKPSHQGGGNNPITQVGDQAIIFSNGALNSGGNLVLAPWSTVLSGMRITSAGNVGIGTASPGRTLEVNGSFKASGGVTFSTSIGASAGTNFLCFDSAQGDVHYANGCTASDKRLKENIVSLDASSTLSKILALRPVSFDWKDKTHYGQGTQFGLIAQEVEQIFPSLVRESDATTTIALSDGSTTTIPHTLSLNYEGLVSPLVAAVQELNLNLITVASTTASSTSDSQSFAASFFGNLFSRITAWFADAANGIHDLYATVIHASEIHAKTVCAQKSDGTDVCVTGDQLVALLAK